MIEDDAAKKNFERFIEQFSQYYERFNEQYKELAHFVADQLEFYLASEPNKNRGLFEYAMALKQVVLNYKEGKAV